MSYLISNQRDIVDQLQGAFEDSRTTPENFGTTPASASFTRAGYNPTFKYTDQPQGVLVHILGDEAHNTKVRVGLSGMLELRTNISDSTRWILKWVFNAAGGGANTIDDSVTFLTSYKILGNTKYRVMKGCLPVNGTLDIPNRGLVSLSCQILVTNPQNEATAHGLTTPTLASTPTDTVWTHLSGGVKPFVIGGITYRDRGFRLSITRMLSPTDSSGDLNVIFAKAAKKTISGSISIFKIDTDNQAKTVLLTERTATRVLKTSVSTLTLSKTQWQSHPTEFEADSADTLVEELDFICNNVAIT